MRTPKDREARSRHAELLFGAGRAAGGGQRHWPRNAELLFGTGRAAGRGQGDQPELPNRGSAFRIIGSLASSRAAGLALWVAVALLACGCGLVKRAMRVPEKTVAAVAPGKQGDTVNPADLQQRLRSFADDAGVRIAQLLDRYAAEAGTPEAEEEALELKLSSSLAVMQIATGSNPWASLLDALSLTTLRRLQLEAANRDQPLEGVLAELLVLNRTIETNAWSIAADVLKPAQQQELRENLEEWHRTHPSMGLGLASKPMEFGTEIRRKALAAPGGTDSFMSLLTLDPMSGLDPAVREVTQTRLFAERAMYTLQRFPTILRWQTELLTRQVLNLPEMRTILTNSAALAQSAERISRATEQASQTAAELPDRFASERQQILAELEAQEGKLRDLTAEVRQALAAGEAMSESLHQTLITFDALMKRFGVGETRPSKPAGTPGRPFDILDYATAAKEMTALAAQLDATLKGLAATLDSPAFEQRKQDLERLADETEARVRGSLNYVFFLGASLIVFGFVCAFLYRFAASRFLDRPRDG